MGQRDRLWRGVRRQLSRPVALDLSHRCRTVRRALPSFFLIAVSGFLLNALAYQLLLTYTPLRYDAALAIVLVAVAALTFVLSRAWAFRSR